MIIELLRRWSELEPEMLESVGENDYSVRLGNRTIWISCNRPTIGGLDVTDTVILCGAIEAAIVEREFRMMTMYGKSLQTFEFQWTVFIGDGTSGTCGQVKCIAPTKLEALLSAYVQALEAAK